MNRSDRWLRAPMVFAVALLALSAAVPLLHARPVRVVSGDIVISQVYGGGGNSGALYANDFVELFNRGASSVNLAGWSVQYAPATTAFATAVPLSGAIASGGYYLVAMGTNGGAASVLPTADATSTINISASSGQVAITISQVALPCGGTAGDCAGSPLVRDLVGYGSPNNAEGNPALAPSNVNAIIRLGNGCTDTDNNRLDFAVTPAAPRNSLSPLRPCALPATATLSPTTTATVTPSRTPTLVTTTATSATPAVNCSSFATWAQAQAFFLANGGPPSDPHGLDADGDGIACEGLKDAPGNSATATARVATPIGTPSPLRIRDVQGIGHSSPFLGAAVANVPGIVTAKRMNGFYFQDPSPDANDATSEGIFVFTGAAPTLTTLGSAGSPINVGDALTVSGSVAEFRPGGTSGAGNLSTTEILPNAIGRVSTGNATPTPAIVGLGGRVPPGRIIDDDAPGNVETGGSFDAQLDGIDFYESLEGMLVQINHAVVVGPTTPTGEVVVIDDPGALLTGQGLAGTLRTPRGGIVTRPDDFNPERIILDDGMLTTPVANVGDRFTTPVVGVVDYSAGNFKVHITTGLGVAPGGLAREVTTAPGPNQLAIATFNVRNLDPSDGPDIFNGLAAQIVVNLRAPDLIALEEVQDNNGPVNDAVVDGSLTYQTLVAAIVQAGGPAYQFRDIPPVDGQDGGEPGGNIRVGFLFRTDRGLAFVDRPGGTATQGTSIVSGAGGPQLQFSPGRIDPTHAAFAGSRKPLAGEFNFQGHRIFVIANHFTSRVGDDPLFGRVQPPQYPSAAQRQQQAMVVNAFVNQLIALDANANVVVLGDFNDFPFSSTLATLRGAILHNLMDTLPENERYTYVFEGNSQALDQILVSNRLLTVGAPAYDVVHINAEFVTQLSDHDPTVVRFTLAPAATPAATATPTTTGTPTSTPALTLTPSVTPTSSPTPTGSGVPVGRNLTLRTSAASPARLEWLEGAAPFGYSILRFSPAAGFATAPAGTLPASALQYVDPSGLTEFVYCYWVVAPTTANSNGPRGESDFLCVLPGSAPAGLPQVDISVQLNQSSTARLTWSVPGNQTSLVLFSINLESGASTTTGLATNQTTTTHDTSGQTHCYLIWAFGVSELIAGSNAVCAAPGYSNLGA